MVTSRKSAVVAGLILCLLILTVVESLSVAAQETTTTASKTDEQVLRNLIRQENEGKNVIKFTEDSIFVSGAYPRPLIGRENRRAAQQRSEELGKSRPNQITKREVKRLVVSQSGDIAYDFGDFTISYDAPDKKRTGFSGSYLRVWRKVGGEWQVDAFFARPNQPCGATRASQPDEADAQTSLSFILEGCSAPLI
jgi:ketosteroid isomerase-like protein